jgi:hypothetical protein
MNSNSSPVDAMLDEFVDRLIKEKNIANVLPEVLEQMKKDLRERVDDRINVGIVKYVPPDKLANFEKLLDNGTDAEVQAFLAGAIPDFSEVIAKEFLDFRTTYLHA